MYEMWRCRSDKYWNTVLWDVAPCSFIATTWNHIPEHHDLNFMNTLKNCIFKICVCVWIHQRQLGKSYNHIIYEDKKNMQNFSCSYQKEKYNLE
jgi:hypothetical protein